MSCLIDVNLLLAAAWETHPRHAEARAWVTTGSGIHSCDISELGFVRVSMTPAFGGDLSSAVQFLNGLRTRKFISRLASTAEVENLPRVTSYKDTTDAYLVLLASQNNLRLATLDQRLLNKPWAHGATFDPLL